MAANDPFRKHPVVFEKLCYNQLLKQLNWGFRLGNQLPTEGTFSKVFHLKNTSFNLDALHSDSNQRLVVKVIDLRWFPSGHWPKLRKDSLKEIELMDKLQFCPQASDLCKSAEIKADQLNAIHPRDGFRAEDPVIYFLVMPEYQTFPLETTLDQASVIQLGIDICKVLQELFDMNEYHRDVKPGNIFFLESGGNRTYILGDYGISRHADGSELTRGVGTSCYYPPEWANSQTNKNGDLYSLAVTMARLLGGKKMENARDFGDIETYLNWDDFKQKKLAFPALQEILHKGLLRDFKIRYQEPREMRADLELLLEYRKLRGRLPTELTLEEVRSFVQNGQPRREYTPKTENVKPTDLVGQAKAALLAKNFRKAAELSRAGHNQGDLRCTALMAYSGLHLVRRSELPAGDRVKLENKLDSAIEEMEFQAMQFGVSEQRTLLRTRAAAMKCILAVSKYESGDTDEFLRLVSVAAEYGSPMACYICGRGMYTGDAPFEKDTRKGWDYLLSASRAGYSAALAYVLREHRRDPYVRIPDDVQDRLERSGNPGQGHALEDILREL